MSEQLAHKAHHHDGGRMLTIISDLFILWLGKPNWQLEIMHTILERMLAAFVNYLFVTATEARSEAIRMTLLSTIEHRFICVYRYNASSKKAHGPRSGPDTLSVRGEKQVTKIYVNVFVDSCRCRGYTDGQLL
jgi:hypothetical protein